MLNRTKFLVKERVAFAKLSDTYDLLDPESGATIGIAQEMVGTLTKILRLFLAKQLMPTMVEVREREGAPALLRIKRGAHLLGAKVEVEDRTGQKIGHFKGKLFSFGGGFYVFDRNENQVAEIKGDWKGWNFQFLGTGGREIGTVTKKWAGIGKELFTSADNYIIALSVPDQQSQQLIPLLLAAGLAIDLVLKERN